MATTSNIDSTNVFGITQSLPANVQTTIDIGSYYAALLIIGNINRTEAQSGVYVLTNNNDAITLKSSTGITIDSVTDNKVKITSAFSNTATLFIYR